MNPAVNTPNYLADNFSQLKRSARVGDKFLVGGGYVAEVSQTPEPTTIFPDDVVPLSATGQVRGSAGTLTQVRCITGTSIAVTIYDNPEAASGTTLFTQTMSAGDVVKLSTDCIDGMYFSFTGTATFEVSHKEF